KHNNGYETAYGHMSAFAKGLEPGKRVRQGQVIGFVGSTGQSTGAHVHYEILVNGRFVDPMRIKLPRGRSLDGPMIAGFEKERDRIDTMMNSRGGTARVYDADRKSTRLNSSHVKISYAVFCLKKKKKRTRIQSTTKRHK